MDSLHWYAQHKVERAWSELAMTWINPRKGSVLLPHDIYTTAGGYIKRGKVKGTKSKGPRPFFGVEANLSSTPARSVEGGVKGNDRRSGGEPPRSVLPSPIACGP